MSIFSFIGYAGKFTGNTEKCLFKSLSFSKVYNSQVGKCSKIQRRCSQF